MDEKLDKTAVALRGDTDGLRSQAGVVISNLQEQASSILAQMLQDQSEAKVQLASVTASAGAKFAELDGLIAQTRAGLEDVAGHSLQLGAQQAALQGQQAAVERHLLQQQQQPPQQPQQQPPQQPTASGYQPQLLHLPPGSCRQAPRHRPIQHRTPGPHSGEEEKEADLQATAVMANTPEVVAEGSPAEDTADSQAQMGPGGPAPSVSTPAPGVITGSWS